MTKEIFTQDCPLCRTSATYYFVTNGQRKYFDCPVCSYFQISRTAEKAVESHQRVREAFSERARLAEEDHLFVILMPPLHESDPADYKVTGSFIPKEQLDL
jgi:hypothetical protein